MHHISHFFPAMSLKRLSAIALVKIPFVFRLIFSDIPDELLPLLLEVCMERNQKWAIYDFFTNMAWAITMIKFDSGDLAHMAFSLLMDSQAKRLKSNWFKTLQQVIQFHYGSNFDKVTLDVFALSSFFMERTDFDFAKDICNLLNPQFVFLGDKIPLSSQIEMELIKYSTATGVCVTRYEKTAKLLFGLVPAVDRLTPWHIKAKIRYARFVLELGKRISPDDLRFLEEACVHPATIDQNKLDITLILIRVADTMGLTECRTQLTAKAQAFIHGLSKPFSTFQYRYHNILATSQFYIGNSQAALEHYACALAHSHKLFGIKSLPTLVVRTRRLIVSFSHIQELLLPANDILLDVSDTLVEVEQIMPEAYNTKGNLLKLLGRIFDHLLQSPHQHSFLERFVRSHSNIYIPLRVTTDGLIQYLCTFPVRCFERTLHEHERVYGKRSLSLACQNLDTAIFYYHSPTYSMVEAEVHLILAMDTFSEGPVCKGLINCLKLRGLLQAHWEEFQSALNSLDKSYQHALLLPLPPSHLKDIAETRLYIATRMGNEAEIAISEARIAQHTN